MNMGTKNLKKPRGCRIWWKCRLFVAAVTIACVDSQDISTCCYKASEPCRSVCEKMSFADNMTSDIIMKEEKILNVYKFCSPKLIEFWICMNQTIQEVITGSGWWGRACCTHVRSTPCREACVSAVNSTALAAVCRRSDELAFFDCVQIQEEAQDCCSNTQLIHCHEACQKVLWRVGLSHVEYSARERAEEACEYSPKLMHCFRDLTASTVHTDTQKYLPCCSMSPDVGCRNTCEEILLRTGELQEIYDALEKACGMPAIDNKLWQCFLRKDPPPETRDPVPHDIAKLHCCSKAFTSDCKKLCFSTYNVGWLLNWQKFYTDCLGDPKEVELSQCIEEVDSPCSLGCSGLTYCSQLNNRPQTLFRSCTSQADLNAHMAVVEQTGSGYVTVSGFQLPLKNSSECTPDVWKSVACALHVKPCTKQGHSSLLCLEECMRVVSSCVQWARAPAPASAAALCARLSHPDPAAPCVPLTRFMTPSAEPALAPQEAVTSPCVGACGATQTCRVNRSCAPGAACSRYTCHDGCPLGDKSSVVVEKGRWARVPSVTSVTSALSVPSAASGAGGERAYRVCACGARGLLQRCQPLPPLAAHHCAMHDQVVAHGEKFYMECNPCTCWAGERVCARRACGAGRGRGALLTRLPCNCPPHHLPVAAHGRTYPNVCLAKCADVKDTEIEFGLRNGCSGTVCSRHSPCLPSPRVCLSQLQSHCPQHICVNTSNCDTQPSSPVCDTDGKTYRNPCQLIMTGSQFAYWGGCLVRCSTTGTVCGINGVTYSSECAAWSEYVSLDYFGPCVAVGPISDEMEPKCQIDRVVCPPLKHPKCIGFTAPGACCPRCGGGLRILYSKKQIERAWYGTNISASVLHLKNLLSALDTHVKVAECALRGYLTIEMEIFVSVETVLEKPTNLQLHTCVLEAEKIADLINRESALMSSDIYLSALSYALIVHTEHSGASISVNISNFLTVISIVISILCNHVLR